MNSNVPFSIGITSFCKSEVLDVSNDLLTKHFSGCACSSCIEVDVPTIELKIKLDRDFFSFDDNRTLQDNLTLPKLH